MIPKDLQDKDWKNPPDQAVSSHVGWAHNCLYRPASFQCHHLNHLRLAHTRGQIVSRIKPKDDRSIPELPQVWRWMMVNIHLGQVTGSCWENCIEFPQFLFLTSLFSCTLQTTVYGCDQIVQHCWFSILLMSTFLQSDGSWRRFGMITGFSLMQIIWFYSDPLCNSRTHWFTLKVFMWSNWPFALIHLSA